MKPSSLTFALPVCCCLLAAVDLQGQSSSNQMDRPFLSGSTVLLGVPTNAPSWRLTGLLESSQGQRAIVQSEPPGQATVYRVISVGEKAGSLELLKVDLRKGSALLREQGKSFELFLRGSGLSWSSAQTLEQARDLSHARHHAARAARDREEDERQARASH